MELELNETHLEKHFFLGVSDKNNSPKSPEAMSFLHKPKTFKILGHKQ